MTSKTITKQYLNENGECFNEGGDTRDRSNMKTKMKTKQKRSEDYDGQVRRECSSCALSLGNVTGVFSIVNHLDVIGRIETHSTVLSSFAPSLFVFIFQFLKDIAGLE